MGSSRGRRSLLRRQLGALGAALSLNTAADRESTRKSAPHDATVGSARAAGGHGEAAIPASIARAPAVAALIAVAAVCCVSPARGDSGTPPTTTPTSTTPDAPPPDPYKPPVKTSKPSKPRQTIAHAAPVYHAPVRTYTPPAPAVRAPTYQAPHRSRPRPARVVHHKRRKARVVHRHVAPKPKPVKVTFNPFANLVATSSLLAATAENTSDRDRYLWLAGMAFAVLAAAGLSLHVFAVRVVE
jgi:hypothetical protein